MECRSNLPHKIGENLSGSNNGNRMNCQKSGYRRHNDQKYSTITGMCNTVYLGLKGVKNEL